MKREDKRVKMLEIFEKKGLSGSQIREAIDMCLDLDDPAKEQIEDITVELMRPKSYKSEPIPDIFVKIGDPLDHIRFGKGTVIDVDGEKCTVLFDDGTKKTLLSKFAGFKI